MVVIKT